MLKKVIVVLILLSGMIAQRAAAEPASGAIRVAVSLQPLAFFVTRVGGDRVTVSTLIPPGVDPHTYEPLPSQVKVFGQADLYIGVGQGIQIEHRWLQQFHSRNKDMQIYMIADSMPSSPDTHSHAPDAHKDPHLWLSINNALLITTMVEDALSKHDPAGAAQYHHRAQKLAAELAELKKDIAKRIAESGVRGFLVFHPAWEYFADEFGLTQYAIEHEGKDSTPRQLSAVVHSAKEQKIKTVFVSPQFSKKSAAAIAREIGGTVATLDPLEGDYMAMMRSAADAICGQEHP